MNITAEPLLTVRTCLQCPSCICLGCKTQTLMAKVDLPHMLHQCGHFFFCLTARFLACLGTLVFLRSLAASLTACLWAFLSSRESFCLPLCSTSDPESSVLPEFSSVSLPLEPCVSGALWHLRQPACMTNMLQGPSLTPRPIGVQLGTTVNETGHTVMTRHLLPMLPCRPQDVQHHQHYSEPRWRQLCLWSVAQSQSRPPVVRLQLARVRWVDMAVLAACVLPSCR